MILYLDYAATSPLDPQVLEAMTPFLKGAFGNPSSTHTLGEEAKAAIEGARQKVARLLGAKVEEIVFTSGGTEANNWALYAITLLKGKRGHIITSSIEHPSILEAARFLHSIGFEVTYLPVDGKGRVDPEAVKRALRSDTLMVSVMYANNETGILQPIREIAEVTREAGILFHTDAVQAVGHIPVNVRELGVDLLSLSAHKFCGPKGVGVLFIREGLDLPPLIRGGGQERGLRSGTENVPAIVGMGKAAEIAYESLHEEGERLKSLREKLYQGMRERIAGVLLNGDTEGTLPGILNVSIEGVPGEALVLNLDLEGIRVSSGAACHSRRLEPSHVLLAMGFDRKRALEAVRFSLGRWTREEEIEHVLDVLPKVVQRLRRA